MKPLSIEDIFAVFDPLIFTFEGTETKVINQKIANVIIENACLDCPTLQIQFRGILTSLATSVADLTFNFTLLKIDGGSEIPQSLTTFILSQQVSTANFFIIVV